MQLEAFRQWTQTLGEILQRDSRVIGLVMVGSAADNRRTPDQWSDHDFFVVTHPGMQEGMRTDLSWLPNAGTIVLPVRETDHGLKVLFADGHLIEFAIFDMEEIYLAQINDYRVIFDAPDGRIAAAVREIAGKAGETSFNREKEMGMLLSLIFVGVSRAARGEVISGSRFIKEFALGSLLRLLAHDQPPAEGSNPDNFEPFRRVERSYPAVAPQIHAALLMPPIEAGSALLDIAEQYLKDIPVDALRVVRKTMDAKAQRREEKD